MKTTSLELFFFDHCEGVHRNLLQRLKPRCLFEIGLRPSWGQRSITIIDPISADEVKTEPLLPGRPQPSPVVHESRKPRQTEAAPSS